MPFDLSTAKPVSSGFDLSTAKPVNQPQEQEQAAPVPVPGSPVDANYGEAALALGSGAVAQVAGGLTGLATAPLSYLPNSPEGIGAGVSDNVIENLTYKPSTPEGQEGLKTLGDLAQKGIDIVNFPISGLGGLIELVSGQGIEQASNTVESVQDRGAGVTAGDRVLDETGSPFAATMARIAPEGAAEVLGAKGVLSAAKSPIAKGIFKYQSPTKRKIAELIGEGSADISTAKYKLDVPDIPNEVVTATTANVAPRPAGRIAEYLDIGGPRVVKDVAAKEAIKQGFDEGVIAAVKGSSRVDRAAMKTMVDIMERGKNNKLYAVKNRPSDVVGDSLLDRFTVVRQANRTAGQQLDGVAKSLKGQKVDYSPAVTEFINDLDEMGVTFGDDLIPNYRGSTIEGVSGAERVVAQMVDRMKNTDIPDGYDVHRMKKFIDEQVTYGKTAEGLAGQTELVLKRLRHNLDATLDRKFPEYDKINTTYAETRGAIDALQDVAGKKMNLVGKNADKATGTLLRRLMSNAQTRIPLMDAIDQLEVVARKSSVFDDDLLTQALFADELDAVFKPVARTSFQGQIDQALHQGKQMANQGLFATAVDAAGAGINKVRGVNEKAAFKSIKDLLSEKGTL